MLLILSLLISMINAGPVSPYGAKVIGLSEGGRPFLKGYDAVMMNPAGANFVDSGQFGLGFDFGDYKSLSVAYVGGSGFHIVQAISNIDSHRSVSSMQTYFGFSYQLEKWWVLGANVGYNYFKSRDGWDMNFGIDFGPGLPSADRSGLIGSVAIRSPFKHGDLSEIAVSLGYSYRSAFNLSIDNIYSFNSDFVQPGFLTAQNTYDIVLAVETFPLESDNFTMSFSARLIDVRRQDLIRAGAGFGYIGEAFKFDIGLYADSFNNNRLKSVIFGISLISGGT